MNSCLIAQTNDEFKSSRLERMLSSMTNSYKHFWLKAFVDEVLAGTESIPFSVMCARMVASSWYPINHFHLSFGVQDELARAIVCCKEELFLSGSASTEEIIENVETSKNKHVRKQVDSLCNYVPYRLIRLFYENELKTYRETHGKLPDGVVNSIILASNRNNAQGAPYVFSKTDDALIVDADWASYLRENRQVISGWLDMRLVEFLQARNPSVPAISLKIHPPQLRKLDGAKKYWNEALALKSMKEIYSGQVFNSESFSLRGPLSIDHFIPWSFVLHDEPWNLAPMFRDSNSSKSDKLPRLETYLEPFANQQFDAFILLRNTGRHRTICDAYLQIEPDLATLEDSLACRQVFVEDITKAIRPLHQIALNQGFGLWTPRFEYAVIGA